MRIDLEVLSSFDLIITSIMLSESVSVNRQCQGAVEAERLQSNCVLLRTCTHPVGGGSRL